MAQEDKGLVLRGFFLFALIGCLVAFVLVVLFWRTGPPGNRDFDLGNTAPSAPGWEIRYNAAASLARRGSPATPWPLLREMLDEKKQLRNSKVEQSDGQAVYDEGVARATMIAALRAIAAWHDKRKGDATHDVPADL